MIGADTPTDGVTTTGATTGAMAGAMAGAVADGARRAHLSFGGGSGESGGRVGGVGVGVSGDGGGGGGGGSGPDGHHRRRLLLRTKDVADGGGGGGLSERGQRQIRVTEGEAVGRRGGRPPRHRGRGEGGVGEHLLGMAC